jgi:hypothetical protein
MIKRVHVQIQFRVWNYNEMSGATDDGDVVDNGVDANRCRAFKIQAFSSSWWW